MHIVVCIKQVPDTTEVRINPETKTLMREGVASILNPFDTYAIEEAVRFKERFGAGTSVTALTMGPPQAEAVLREAISMGVDEGVLLCDRAFAGSDTYATSYALAMAIRKIGDADIIIFGKQAADGDTAQVGPGVAAHLDLPQITYVRKIESVDETQITAQRMLEDGNETIKSTLPCVLTVIKELNVPRLPSLKGKMAAKKAELKTWTATDIGADPALCGLDGSPTKVGRLFPPPVKSDGEIISGEPDEAVAKLVEKLLPAIIGAA
ncbi:MAG: electron transfer flavoprotein subunit beta/FixA family protein [Kiritimatiellaeota bacterium]|nr:electron transfer flavoprotein subunit beta/FixA family protein [Kiritimatiellota bacterium]